MKIAYLSTFYPYRGGIAQFNASLFNAFNNVFKNDFEIKAYTFTRQYPDFLFPGKTQFVTEEDVAIKIDAERVLDTINPFSYIKTINSIKIFEPDILIMKYWLSYLAPSLGYVAGHFKKKNTKVITIIDNVIPHETNFFDKLLTKYFFNRNSGFMLMSEKAKHDLLKFKPDAKYLYSPHPLYNHFGDSIPKSQAKTKLGLDLNKKTLLFFGLIRDYKGLDLLIDAFGKLSSEYQLVIAGEPYGSFDKYSEQINKLPNKQDVYAFARYINDTEVPIFFSAADVCILPYRSATQSGIALISYHFDLPMIATSVGGLQEVIRDKESGIIVAPNSNDIEAGIKFFFENDNIQTFKANIAKIKEELSWEKFGENIVNFSKTL